MFITSRMPFMSPNQQHHNTDEVTEQMNVYKLLKKNRCHSKNLKTNVAGKWLAKLEKIMLQSHSTV